MVADRHLPFVGRDCLVAFKAGLYSLPVRRVRPRQLVEVRAGVDTPSLRLLAADTSGSTLLAVRPRAKIRGSWVVDETHWDGLPDGHTRAVTTTAPEPAAPQTAAADSGTPSDWLARTPTAQVTVSRRTLAVYESLTSVTPIVPPAAKNPVGSKVTA